MHHSTSKQFREIIRLTQSNGVTQLGRMHVHVHIHCQWLPEGLFEYTENCLTTSVTVFRADLLRCDKYAGG